MKDIEPKSTKCVSAGTRLYYFDAYVDSKGRPYLSISEIPKGNSPVQTKRQRIFVHIEDLDAFGEAVAEIISEIKMDHLKTSVSSKSTNNKSHSIWQRKSKRINHSS